MRNNLNIRKYKAKRKYRRVHIIINPASGKNEPIINTINSVFKDTGIEWSVDITKKFGDATRMTKKAVGRVDLIASYGGDGTLHEVINGILGTDMPIAILPGGTGNGFGAGLKLPNKLKESLELIVHSKSITKVDAVKINKGFFVSRMYIGIEPEEQTSRELKDKYGVLAYGVNLVQRGKNIKPIKYEITIDGKKIKEEATKCYVVNSGSTGLNINIGDFNPTDGILDIFTMGKDLEHISGATERFLGVKKQRAEMHYWRGKNIKIKTSPSQPVWADGEFMGRTPIKLEILPKSISVVVSDNKSK